TQDLLPSELVPVLVEISAKDPDKAVSDSAFQSLAATAKANKSLAPTIEKALGTLPRRVYIQIAGSKQREKARQIQQKLIVAGFIVPGIEDVSGKAVIPKTTSVRYFTDSDKATAGDLVQMLRANGLPSAAALPVSSNNARPGTLELWFS